MHDYPFTLHWSGSTQDDPFSRDATATAPGKAALRLSAGAEPGDMSKWNPEDLLGASLAMCHTLTFLALAKKVGIEVREVTGANQAVLEKVGRVPTVTKIILRPTITLGPDADEAKAAEMYEKAHKYCYIANSIKAETVMEPTFVKG